YADTPSTSQSLAQKVEVIADFFSLLHGVVENPNPARILANIFMELHMGQLDNTPPQLSIAGHLLVYYFLQQRLSLKNPSLRTLTLEKMAKTPTADRLWRDISEELLVMSNAEITESAERMLNANFTVRMRISLKDRLVKVEPTPSIMSESLKEEITQFFLG